jgi:hypothetical protein
MRLFGRKRGVAPGVDVSLLLLQGEDAVTQLIQAHASWGLGEADRWDLDQRTGLITWSFPDRTATARAQILGSHNPSAGSWLWAWANTSILPDMGRDSLVVREWAEKHGQHALAQPKIAADEEAAATIIALAVRITRAKGVYRDATRAAIPIITFGPVTVTTESGETTTFEVDIAEA